MKDLVDNQGKINERYITPKLTDKTNWIAELTMIKKAIPKEWLDRLQSNIDWTNYQLNIRNIKLRLKHKNKEKNLLKMQNKDIYNTLCENNQSEPISYIYWGNTLNLPNIKKKFIDCFQFIFQTLKDNKLKIFRWKLAHKILVNTHILYKWKIIDSPLCKICNVEDNYQHFFIDCKFVNQFCNR